MIETAWPPRPHLDSFPHWCDHSHPLWMDMVNIPDHYKPIVGYCMFELPSDVRKKYEKMFKTERIDVVLENYFKWRFHHAGLKGCTIVTEGEPANDNERVFSEICGQLAEVVCSAYHYYPLDIIIRKTLSYSQFYGMSISYFSCKITVDPCAEARWPTFGAAHSNGHIAVNYAWPHQIISQTGTHDYRRYYYNLSDPDSLDKVQKLLLDLCSVALKQGPPE